MINGFQQQTDDKHLPLDVLDGSNQNIPLVSIVIPVYNAERYIEEAIISALDQTYPNIEIIIIDDGSTDLTSTIIGKFQGNPIISILSHKNHKNLGASCSRKIGIDKAKGKYIAFLDADDIFMPQKISIQVAIMEKNPEVVLCHSNVGFINESIKYPYKNFFKLENRELVYRYSSQSYYILENHICTPTTMVKGDVIKRIPYMKERLFPYQYEDWFNWILLGEEGLFLYIPQKLIHYRYRPSSTSKKIFSHPLQRDFIYFEMLINLLGYIRNEIARSITILQLQNTIITLFKDYFRLDSDGIEKEQISLDTLRNEVFFGGIQYELIPARYQNPSIIAGLSADEIAKNTHIMKIAKAFVLRLILLFRLKFGKPN